MASADMAMLSWLVAAVGEPAVAGHGGEAMAPEDTSWKRIERHDGVVVYVPPDGSDRSTRVEYVLPSGRTIVDDRDAGLAVRIEMSERVDWQTFNATGGKLGEDDVRERAAAGDCFVVLRYQDAIDVDGFVTQSVLRSVEEYAGRRWSVRRNPISKFVRRST